MFAQLVEAMEFFESQFGLSVAMVIGAGASINVIVYMKDSQGETIQVGVKSTMIDLDISVKQWAEGVAIQLDSEIEKALGGHNEH